MIIYCKNGYRNAERKPISIKTIGTIRSTSIPIIAAHLIFCYGFKARPTLYGLIEMKGLQRLRSIKSTNNRGIDITIGCQLLVKGVEKPRVSDPCAIKIRYSNINKNLEKILKGLKVRGVTMLHFKISVSESFYN